MISDFRSATGDSRCHRLSELDALLDDDAVHRARDARSLRRGVARDRDAAVLDDLEAHLRGFQRLCREVTPVLHYPERVAADQSGVEERLLVREIALGVLEPDPGVGDARLHVRQRLRLVDVRLDLRQDVSDPDDRALAHLQSEDAPGNGGLDVHLRDRIDHADLADAHLEVFGLHLSETERGLRRVGRFVLAAGGNECPPGDHDSQEPEQDPALFFLRHLPSGGMHTGTRAPGECSLSRPSRSGGG